jgi:hypothetical protein
VGPYRLVESDTPTEELGDGRISDHPTMVAAAVAFVNSRAACKQLVYDDGYTCRFLDRSEQQLLERVAGKLAYTIVNVGEERE